MVDIFTTVCRFVQDKKALVESRQTKMSTVLWPQNNNYFILV
jgi:hypothetical protein